MDIITTDMVTELPIWGLPEDLQELIKNVSQAYNCPQDYCVMSLISAAATAIGKKAWHIYGGQINYPFLWSLIIGKSGIGKSQPMSFFYEPLTRYNKKLYNEYERKIKQWRHGQEKPICSAFLLNDINNRALRKRLSYGDALCWYGEFGIIASRWSQQIVPQLRELFNTRRCEKHPEQNTNLSIFGEVRPFQLKCLYERKHWETSDILQCFLCTYPDEKHIKPHYKYHELDNALKTGWCNKINELLTMPPHEAKSDFVVKKMFIEYINKLKEKIEAEYNDNSIMTSFLNNLQVHLCRWALTVTILWGESEHISADTARYSIECMRYFQYTSEKIYRLLTDLTDKTVVASSTSIPRSGKNEEIKKEKQKNNKMNTIENMENKKVLTREQVMTMFAISSPTLWRLQKNGTLTPRRFGKGRRVYFFEEEVLNALSIN